MKARFVVDINLCDYEDFIDVPDNITEDELESIKWEYVDALIESYMSASIELIDDEEV